MKKKMLVVGITMNCAGSEKSFLSFINCIDFNEFEVDLLLAKKEGLFLELLPPEVNVIEMPECGDMFLMSGANAAKTLTDCFVKKNPLVLFEIFPYFAKIVLNKKKASFTATRLWVRMLRKFPEVQKEYDVALAYWGDRTMFYMIDKVKAAKKIAWLHFDYSHPERDDGVYLKYFKACDKIVTVSQKIDDALKLKLPEVADKVVMMENINNPKLIKDMASGGKSFDDNFDGKRVLTIGRISEQKGYDFAVGALKKLKDDGFNLCWYILGDGDAADKEALINNAKALGVEDMIVFLGTTTNPYPYIKDCDIYAQPSRHEGKPIAVEEAKILGKPIMISNYLSASEQLKDGEYGVISDIGIDGTYEGLKKLLSSDELCRQFEETLAKPEFGNAHEIEKFYDMLK